MVIVDETFIMHNILYENTVEEMSNKSKRGHIGQRVLALTLYLLLIITLVLATVVTPKTSTKTIMSIPPTIIFPTSGNVWAGINLIVWSGSKDMEDGWTIYCDADGFEPYDCTIASNTYAYEFLPLEGNWTYEWDTTTVPDGYWHIVIVEVGPYSIGALPGISLSFQVDNAGGDAPPVSVAYGSPSVTTHSNATIWSNVADDNGLTTVSLYVSVNEGYFVLAPTLEDNPVVISGTSTTVNWTYTPITNGSHDFFSLAVDNIGQIEANSGYDFRMMSIGEKTTTENITIMEATVGSGLVYTAAVWTGEYVYIFGGWDGSHRHSEILQYDPTTDSVSTMTATLPYDLAQAPAIWNGEYAFIFGGWKGDKSNEIHRYDPITDTLTTVGTLPTARNVASAVWTGEYVYIFGGWGASYLDEIIRFDPFTNVTTQMSSTLPTARIRTSAIWSGNRAYVFGGVANPGGTINEIVCFDPANDTLTTTGSVLPSPRYWTSAIFDGEMAYIFGGSPRLNEQYNDEIVQFDPISGNVTVMPDRLPDGREGTASVWADDAAYIIGGMNGTYACLDEIVKYIPDSIDREIEFEMPLRQGWNLISLPLVQNNESISEVLSSINGKWNYIQVYDALKPTPWKSSTTYKPSQLNDLQFLNHKIGFWINITEPNMTITVRGYIQSHTSIPLCAGWNLVGYPTLNNSMSVADAFWGTGVDRVEVDSLSPYRISEVDPNYLLRPGEGYWVHVPVDSVWVVDW